MRARARWSLDGESNRYLLIRDLGPWDRHPTVTNDAEAVVAEISPILRGRRLFYYDSTGQLDELLVLEGRFAGFRRGPAVLP